MGRKHSRSGKQRGVTNCLVKASKSCSTRTKGHRGCQSQKFNKCY